MMRPFLYFMTVLALLLSPAAHSQTNILVGNISSFNLLGRSNVTMQLSLISPKNRYLNGIFVSNDPLTNASDGGGNFYFTNVTYGVYSLNASDSTGSRWNLTVYTNTVGVVPMMSLVTNSTALPPNPTTSYYTVAQVDALLDIFTNTTVRGLNGTNGLDGLNGTNGATGPPGVAATVIVTNTITLPPGQLASVINLGNDTNAVLQFSIPQGVAGAGGGGSSNLWSYVPTGNAIYPNGTIGSDTVWTNTGTAIFPL